MASAFNPIQSVTGLDGNEIAMGPAEEVRAPSVFRYSRPRVSSPGAGRKTSGKMDTLLMGRSIKIAMSWRGVDLNTGKNILQAFEYEYVRMVFYDARTDAFQTGVFYLTDPDCVMHNFKVGIWESISFDAIMRHLV